MKPWLGSCVLAGDLVLLMEVVLICRGLAMNGCGGDVMPWIGALWLSL
jgi:hypothetical protein